MEQCVKHFLDALRVRGAIKVEGHLFAVDRSFEESTGQSHAFDAAGGEHAAIVHLIEFIFDGAGTAVDDKYFHCDELQS